MTPRTGHGYGRVRPVARDGRDPVDARSLLSVLALGAAHGDSVVLAAEGEGAETALEELAVLLSRDHDAGDED
ncbi:HPr family phosphocarrier protein [Streptomyces hygroscopicus]|uniref:HPr family phosphocarrier protein n=1 Tax=Streptomyces hygroscopicus TaxID=1912 RepID=UPI0036CF1685